MSYLPNGVIGLIVQYAARYEFDEYSFPNTVLARYALSENPNALDYLRDHPELIHWPLMARNPGISSSEIETLSESTNDAVLCSNPAAIDWIERMLADEQTARNISWYWLCANPRAMHIVKKNMDKVFWMTLSANPSDDALDILLANEQAIHWDQFSRNTNKRAIAFLSKYPERIDWSHLSENPAARDILIKNHQKMNKVHMLANPAMIKTIKFWKNSRRDSGAYYYQNSELDRLARNPAIFKLTGSVGLANVLFSLRWPIGHDQ